MRIPFSFRGGQINCFRNSCYLRFVLRQAALQVELRESGSRLRLNIALVFGVPLAVGEAYACQHQQAAEDLREADGLAQ